MHTPAEMMICRRVPCMLRKVFNDADQDDQSGRDIAARLSFSDSRAGCDAGTQAATIRDGCDGRPCGF